jgi:hypothetical protein
MAKKKKISKSVKPERVRIQTGSVPRMDRPDLPTIWVDRMMINLRTEPDLATLRFYTFLMNLDNATTVEVSRLQTSVDHVRQIINVLARTINYYPTPESAAEKNAK